MKTKLLSLSSILLIFSCALIPISLAEYQHTTISECSQPITTGWVRINVTFDCTFFGYQISITNFGDEPVEGNLTIRITTEAWIVLKGETLGENIVKTWEPGETQILKLGPILGFGASTSMLHATLKVKNVTDTTNVPWKGFLFLTCPMIHPISFYFQWR